MNLAIGRGQTVETDRKGQPQGASYEFSCRLDLTPHEQELVSRYAQAGFPLLLLRMDDIRDYNPRRDEDRALTVARLVEGWSVQSRFMTDLQRTEAALKEACTNFRALLSELESYGGQEVFEC